MQSKGGELLDKLHNTFVEVLTNQYYVHLCKEKLAGSDMLGKEELS